MKKTILYSILLGIAALSIGNTALAKTENVSIKKVDLIQPIKLEHKENLLPALNVNQDVLDIEAVKRKEALDLYKKENTEYLKTLNLKNKLDEYSKNINSAEKIEDAKSIIDSANKESESNTAEDTRIELERVKAEADKVEAERVKAAEKALEDEKASQANQTSQPETTNYTAPVDNSGGNGWGPRQTRNGFTAHSPKEFIALSESGGSYTASNGYYYGRYQLGQNLYVGFDTSPEGQEAAADAYVAGRYGNWQAAYEYWIINLSY